LSSELFSSRKPWVPLVLGAVSPGLGHVWGGEWRRGLAGMVLFCLVILPAIRLSLVTLSWSPRAIVTGMVVGFGLFLLVPLDGARVASRVPAGAVPMRSLVCKLLVTGYGILALLLALISNKWIADRFPIHFYQVENRSMTPALLPGDLLLADARSAALRSLKSGQIVIYENLGHPRSFLVKRIHAISGDSVFVVGDNEEMSYDSRQTGPIHVGRVRGVPFRIYASRAPQGGSLRWGRFGRSLLTRTKE